MTNNKAREINSPVIKQLINETTPEELTKIDTQMTNNKQQTAVDIAKNTYITSDEEIKEGDWVIFNELEIVKCIYSKNGEYLFSKPLLSSSNHHFSYFKKIILTTDQDLIKDGIQPIEVPLTYGGGNK
jgi:hypothetical protein